MVVPDTTNPFFATLARAVEEAAAARGYALLLANSGGSAANERRQVRNLASRRVDGVFLSSVLFEPDLTELEHSARSPPCCSTTAPRCRASTRSAWSCWKAPGVPSSTWWATATATSHWSWA